MKRSDGSEGPACRWRQGSGHAKIQLMAAEQFIYHRKSNIFKNKTILSLSDFQFFGLIFISPIMFKMSSHVFIFYFILLFNSLRSLYSRHG